MNLIKEAVKCLKLCTIPEASVMISYWLQVWTAGKNPKETIYLHIRQIKAANPHIQRSETRDCLAA